MHNLLENCPNVTEVVKLWFTELMIESLNDGSVPEEFKEHMRQQGVSTEQIVKILEGNPRVLFDVFDANDVIINVLYKKGLFYWNIDDFTEQLQSYSNRRLAESDAIRSAFNILEEKLKPTLDEGQDSTTGDSEVPTEE